MSTGNEISKNPENALVASKDVPDWMLKDGALGTEDMAGYIQPARLLITQPTSKPPLNEYDIGTPLIMPNCEVVGKYVKSDDALEQPLIMVPILFYPEFTLDNPRSIWPTKGSVRDRSLDPQSVIAIKSQNPKEREVPCPDEPSKMMKYSTRLNFIVALLGEQFAGGIQTALIQFKSAEYRHGMSFNSLIRARRRPIFGCQFALEVKQRKNDKGIWYGFSAFNPPDAVGPWVQSQELYEALKAEHLEMSAALKGDKIRYADDDALEADAIHEGEPEM